MKSDKLASTKVEEDKNIFVIVFPVNLFDFRKFIEMGFIDKDRIGMWGWVSAVLSSKTAFMSINPHNRFYYVGLVGF